jgi:hypothetical protein
MNTGDLNTGPAKLKKAWEKLWLRWEETRQHWRDEVSREFEENHLAVLEPHLAATAERMHSLAAAVAAARQEFEGYR